MDNLSHSLVGLAAGELIHRSLPAHVDAGSNALRRRLLLMSCWLASNFPDLDIILTPLLPAPLGYLLHHRGHTHTVLYALPQALLLFLLIWLLWPGARRLLREDGAARKGLMLALGLGFGLHLGMDYLNSYGIHPFHPYDSRWFFGDMVFILEPLFWVAFGMPMAMTVRRQWLKIIFIALIIGLPLFFTIKAFLAWASLAVLVVLAGLVGGIQYRDGERGRTALTLAVLLSFGFIGMQRMASDQAKSAVARNLHARHPESTVLDVAMTPFPTNPMCWNFVSIESHEDAGTYRLRRGQLSLAPRAFPLDSCPAGFLERALSHPADQHASSSMAFLFEMEGSLGALRELNATNCHFSAWLRFARAPVLDDGEASDLRFSFGMRDNFTMMNLSRSRGRECSRHIPGWSFPREDLLVPKMSGTSH